MAALGLLVGSACAVGQGTGEISGEVIAPEGLCDLGDDPSYALEPSFFGAEVIEDALNLRIQRGSHLESDADGLIVLVRDVNEVRRDRVGLPIPVDPDETGLVQLVLYLNESCPSGFPSMLRTRPFVLEAYEGTITFDAIYAPEIDPGATLMEARLEDVVFLDPAEPDERRAVMSGSFSFFYQRGGPAQRFP